MAKIINNIRIKRISAKRDKILEKIKFNESYLNVAKHELEEKNVKKIQSESIKIKRFLLPLEKRAASDKETAQWFFDKKLKKLTEKQRLPRLAVEQTYNRIIAKQGKEEANEYKADAILKLDSELEELKIKWAKHIDEASSQKNQEALKYYKSQIIEQSARLEEYKKNLELKAADKYNALEKKAKAIDALLEKKEKIYNDRLIELNKETAGSMKNSDTVLEINDLLMLFDGLRAVDELSFNVKEGEIFGLIGPNGAGKTTVFNCITQFNKATGGSIYYRNANGEIIDVNGKKVHEIVKIGIVRTFQNLELIWELTVLENMLIGAHSLYGAGFIDHLLHTRKLRREEKIMKTRALEVLERLNLLEYKDVIPYGLPYGILKRIELARTLMVNPRLIILDEPAAGLNDAETEELAETIYKIRNDYKCTIFLVEHDMGLVMNICDTVCAISFGKKLALGTPAEIQGNPLVQEAYLGGTMTEDENE